MRADHAAAILDFLAPADRLKTGGRRFAMTCDRMQGFPQNVLSGGFAWKEHGVRRAETLPRMMPAMRADPRLATLIDRRHERGGAERLPGPRR